VDYSNPPALGLLTSWHLLNPRSHLSRPSLTITGTTQIQWKQAHSFAHFALIKRWAVLAILILNVLGPQAIGCSLWAALNDL
jgi:hypothetical protein